MLREVWSDTARVVNRHVQDRVDNFDRACLGIGCGCLSQVHSHEKVDVRLLVYPSRDLEEGAVLHQLPKLGLVLESLPLGPGIGHRPVRV